MAMVWCACSTFRSIVEDGKFWEQPQYFCYLVEIVYYTLWFMVKGWYGKMLWQYWIWVDEELKSTWQVSCNLLFRPVLGT